MGIADKEFSVLFTNSFSGKADVDMVLGLGDEHMTLLMKRMPVLCELIHAAKTAKMSEGKVCGVSSLCMHAIHLEYLDNNITHKEPSLSKEIAVCNSHHA